MIQQDDLDVAALREEVARLKAVNVRLKKLYEQVSLELALLKKQLFGRKAERIDPRQAQLAFDLVTGALGRLAQGDESAMDDAQKGLDLLKGSVDGEDGDGDGKSRGTTTKDVSPKKGHGRQPLSLTNLPVEDVVIEPAEVALGEGCTLERIGEDVSEHIDRRPASLVRVRVIRPKYAVKGAAPAAPENTADEVTPTSLILQGEVPERPLPRSNAGPGLLAHVLVLKYADHLPLNRQVRIFKREGLTTSTSTLWGWVQGSTELLTKIVDAMWKDAHDAPLVLSDATGVLVRAEEECKRAHFYVVVVPGRSVLYRFTDKNNGETVADILGGFHGKVQVDASSVYHQFFRENESRIEVGCWAHARRKFYNCIDIDPDPAMTGVGFIGLLYDAHNASMTNGVVDGSRRRELAGPVLEKMERWLQQQRQQGDPDSPFVKACNYVVNQWIPLTRFLEDGAIRLDNNPAELELRRQAVGRKNWLFLGSDSGAVANTTTVSLVASCEMHGVEPWAYLRDVLTILPAWNQLRLIDLAPHRWRETLQQPETQRLLDAMRLLDRDQGHDGHNVTKAPALS